MQDIREVTPFGVDVAYDLADEGSLDRTRQLFAEHGLLVAHEQSLSHGQQVALMSHLGPVIDHLSTLNVVSNVRPDGYLGDSELTFHSDASYTPKPMHAVSLHAVRIERSGETSTKVASGIRAFDQLPAALRERIDGLKALHLAAVGESTLGGRQRLCDYPADGPRAVHPLVMTDPVTQKPSLYVPYTNTDHVVGLEPEESQALLDELQGLVFAGENVYEHFWRDGDVMIWSNIGCLHARGAMPDGERTLNRVCTTDADVEMYEQSTRLIQQKRRTLSASGVRRSQ